MIENVAMQIIVATAAVITALGVIWRKVLRPGARLLHATEAMLPMVRSLTTVFADSPEAFVALRDIASQFHADSGTSLRDVVNRLEAAAIENARAGDALKVGVESSRVLAERDRQQLDRLIILLDRLTIRVEHATTGVDRIEADREAVASDLAAAQHRADAAGNEPGESADAAASTPEEGNT